MKKMYLAKFRAVGGTEITVRTFCSVACRERWLEIWSAYDWPEMDVENVENYEFDEWCDNCLTKVVVG